MLKTIHTNNAPAAIGPYSQAVVAGNFIFCSGQLGIDPKSGVLVEGVVAQTKQVLENLKQVLAAAGADGTQVVKTTMYLTNLADFTTVNELYGSFFGEHKPARATVEVSNLPKGALVEIEAIAVLAI